MRESPFDPFWCFTEELSKRLKHYQKGLKKVVEGLMKDKFSIKGVLPKGWRNEGYNNSRQQYYITIPGRNGYRSSRWMNPAEYNRYASDLDAKVTKKSISIAARYLGMKIQIITLILSRN